MAPQTEKTSKPWFSRFWQLASTSIEAVNRIAISESFANTVLSRTVLIHGEDIFVLLLERSELVFNIYVWECVWEGWRWMLYLPTASVNTF
jgi:hypothetical protein